MDWRTEIVDLHALFEQWFNGTAPTDAFGRCGRVLRSDFTIVSPDGVVTGREPLLDGLRRSRGSRPSLRIRVSDLELLADLGAALVVRYREHHDAPDRRTVRISTAVMVPASDAPCGVQWQTVHETWQSPGV